MSDSLEDVERELKFIVSVAMYGATIDQEYADEWIEWLIKQAKKAERYEGVLRIYADPTSYVTEVVGMEIEATVMKDRGAMAIEALEESE